MFNLESAGGSNDEGAVEEPPAVDAAPAPAVAEEEDEDGGSVSEVFFRADRGGLTPAVCCPGATTDVVAAADGGALGKACVLIVDRGGTGETEVSLVISFPVSLLLLLLPPPPLPSPGCDPEPTGLLFGPRV